MVKVVRNRKPLLELDFLELDDLREAIAVRKDSINQDILYWEGYAERRTAAGDPSTAKTAETLAGLKKDTLARLDRINCALALIQVRRLGKNEKSVGGVVHEVRRHTLHEEVEDNPGCLLLSIDGRRVEAGEGEEVGTDGQVSRQ